MAQGKGNPEINKKVATSALVTTLLSGVGFYLGNRYWEAVASFGGQFFEHWGDGFAAMWPLIAENPAHIDMSPNAMLAGLTMCVLVWLFWLRYVAFVGNFRAGEESGSARWGTLKEGKQFRDLTTEDNNLIFTQNFGLALHRPKFNPELDRNLNVLVVGGSGSGKTFNYVTPNICQLNTSYFITDPKGTLLKDAGFLFTDNGYKVKSFNTINLDESMHYNPLKYVKTDTDILSFVNCYIMNTNGDGKAGDPFWENSEKSCTPRSSRSCATGSRRRTTTCRAYSRCSPWPRPARTTRTSSPRSTCSSYKSRRASATSRTRAALPRRRWESPAFPATSGRATRPETRTGHGSRPTSSATPTACVPPTAAVCRPMRTSR